MESALIKDIVTILIALVGLSLGIYNLLRSKRNDQVSLLVKPLAIYKVSDNQFVTNEIEIPQDKDFFTLGVKVINLSKFEVSITETGFLLDEANQERICFPHAMILGASSTLPIRIPSRESVTIAFSPDQLPNSIEIRKKINAVYIHTACELEFLGTSKVINGFKSV